jgi:hypothetical protein
LTSRSKWFKPEFFFSVLVVLDASTITRVSSLRFTALEAGREGTKGCLALICLDGIFDSCGVGGRSAARLTKIAASKPDIIS